MMTGFKARFEPFVMDGSKQHTLRDIRKGTRQIVQGDRLDCYTNVRQKNMRLIGRWICVRVQVARFELCEDRGAVMSIDDVELDANEANAFAWRDGFRHMNTAGGYYLTETKGCFVMMMKYWVDEGKSFPFTKQLLHWRFKDRLPNELPKKPRKPRKPRGH